MCDVRIKWFQAMRARYLDAPLYVMEALNPPYGADVNDPRVKKHYMDSKMEQLHALVAFLEQQTGKKLDQRKLAQAIARSLEAQRLFYRVHELRKAVPSPMPSEDTFASIIPQLYMRGQQLAVDFYRLLHDEVKARVEKGTGVIPNEKYRLMWVGIPPWFNMGIFNYLEGLGAVSAMETQYYVGVPIDVDPEKGLEALAERSWLRTLEQHRQGAEIAPEQAGPGGEPDGIPTGLVAGFVRDYKIDGGIMHLVRSCRTISFGQAHYRNVLQKSLDLPMLFVESDMADPRLWSDSAVKAQIGAFMELLEAKKAGAGRNR